MRGMLPAMILADWERRTGKPIASQVDLIYGVSIGGILGLITGAGLPASQAVDFFTVDGPQIFRKRWTSLFGLWSPKYSDVIIESVLQNRLSTRRMLDCKTRVATYALDIKSGDPFFFKSWDGDATSFMWEAGRATSAAQTYFPSLIKGKMELWDGGNVDNNPSVFAYADAKKLWPDDDIKILSLGCGMDTGAVQTGSLYNAGLIRAGLATVSLLFEADSAATDYTMGQLIGANYLRSQPVLPRPLALDDASVEGLSWLRESGQQAVRSTSVMLDKFLS